MVTEKISGCSDCPCRTDVEPERYSDGPKMFCNMLDLFGDEEVEFVEILPSGHALPNCPLRGGFTLVLEE